MVAWLEIMAKENGMYLEMGWHVVQPIIITLEMDFFLSIFLRFNILVWKCSILSAEKGWSCYKNREAGKECDFLSGWWHECSDYHSSTSFERTAWRKDIWRGSRTELRTVPACGNRKGSWKLAIKTWTVECVMIWFLLFECLDHLRKW